MPSYIAFLRAVNVGGRVFKMAELRSCLEKAGLQEVETYIQTGNVRFTTPMRSRPKVEAYVEETLAGGCGFDVPAILFTPAELRKVHDDAMRLPSPFKSTEGRHGRYVTFFKEADVPATEVAEEIAAWNRPGESAAVLGRAVHIWLDHPTMQAEFFGAFKKVLLPGTNRNLKVVTTLAERWGT
jgi:uncharacterized protein (DUF1697 family)